MGTQMGSGGSLTIILKGISETKISVVKKKQVFLGIQKAKMNPNLQFKFEFWIVIKLREEELQADTGKSMLVVNYSYGGVINLVAVFSWKRLDCWTGCVKGY